ASGATSLATDKSGGNLVLSGGTSTGTGTSSIQFQTSSAGASGTADNASSTKMTILGNGNVGIGTTNPATNLEVNGALKVSGTGTNIFVTPVGSSIPTKINIPLLNPGNFGQILIMGLPSTASTSARAASFVDARTTVNHQPTVAVLTPDESQIFGLSADGSNSSGYITSTVDLGFKTNGTERMHILSNGNIGIGNTPGFKLDVTGDINTSTVLRIAGTQICSIGGCTSSSDRKLKKNIKPLANSLDNILKLQGVGYDWKDKIKFTDKHQVGLIAQDLEKIYPEVVVTDPKSGLKSVAYGNLIAPVVEAIKELNKRVAELFRASEGQFKELASVKAENNQIKADNFKIKSVVEKLKQENAAIKAYLCGKDPKAAICK
ncbi:MAG: tail fiber domain-containing protein, partial [Bacteriovorax sp.]|nr:tail fiber domain-containing protein [Bacteriovorax sp.]